MELIEKLLDNLREKGLMKRRFGGRRGEIMKNCWGFEDGEEEIILGLKECL